MQSGKVCSAAWKIRHHTVSLGVADRRCLLDCAVSLFVSNIGFMSILKTLNLCTGLRIQYIYDGLVLV